MAPASFRKSSIATDKWDSIVSLIVSLKRSHFGTLVYQFSCILNTETYGLHFWKIRLSRKLTVFILYFEIIIRNYMNWFVQWEHPWRIYQKIRITWIVRKYFRDLDRQIVFLVSYALSLLLIRNFNTYEIRCLYLVGFKFWKSITCILFTYITSKTFFMVKNMELSKVWFMVSCVPFAQVFQLLSCSSCFTSIIS